MCGQTTWPTDRPVGFHCPDIEEYETPHGLNVEGYRDLLPGPLLESIGDFESFLRESTESRSRRPTAWSWSVPRPDLAPPVASSKHSRLRLPGRQLRPRRWPVLCNDLARLTIEHDETAPLAEIHGCPGGG